MKNPLNIELTRKEMEKILIRKADMHGGAIPINDRPIEWITERNTALFAEVSCNDGTILRINQTGMISYYERIPFNRTPLHPFITVQRHRMHTD